LADRSISADLTPEQARERLAYDPATGSLTWKENPARGRSWNAKFAGRPAGYINSNGYVFVGLRGYGPRWMFAGHRLAWAIHYGEWPDGVIDHINGVTADNRISNLRMVTMRENTWNRTKPPRASSGVRGVSQSGGRWYATITRNWRTIRLGSFATKAEAAAAREAAEWGPWPDFSRQRRTITA
jgi:hypothetical protein